MAAADDGFDADPEHLVFTNRTTAAATYLVIVDNWSGTGTFTLSAVLDTPPADEVCSGATALTAGTPLTNQSTVGYQNDYEFGTNWSVFSDKAGPVIGPLMAYEVLNQRRS